MKPPSKPVFFMEIIASLCADHHVVNLNSLEKNLVILRRLQERGYRLFYEDGAVSCELAVPSENLTMEYEAAISILRKT